MALRVGSAFIMKYFATILCVAFIATCSSIETTEEVCMLGRGGGMDAEVVCKMQHNGFDSYGEAQMIEKATAVD